MVRIMKKMGFNKHKYIGEKGSDKRNSGRLQAIRFGNNIQPGTNFILPECNYSRKGANTQREPSLRTLRTLCETSLSQFKNNPSTPP